MAEAGGYDHASSRAALTGRRDDVGDSQCRHRDNHEIGNKGNGFQIGIGDAPGNRGILRIDHRDLTGKAAVHDILQDD
jgi:hypothetical protein